MKFLDPNAYPAWDELCAAASAYASLTGGRYVADDFESGKTPSRDGEEFGRARVDARNAVATFRLLAKEKEPALAADYEEALTATIDQAAHNAMITALKALDKWDHDDAAADEVFDPDAPDAPPLTPDFVTDASDDALAARLRARANQRAEPHAAAKLRAASFIADFGAAHGLKREDASSERKKSSDASAATEALLRAFYQRVDDSARGRSAFDDAMKPYKELLAVQDLQGAKAWASCYQEEALLVGAAALAIGAGALALLFGGRARRKK